MIKIKQIFKCSDFEKKLSGVLFLSITFLLVAYLVLITKTINDASFRKEAESLIAKKQYTVSELESIYIEKKNSIDLKLAKAEGFVKTPTKHYISSAEIDSSEFASKR